MLFTNLPLRYIEDEPHYINLFLEHRLNPELGFDAMALDRFAPDWHIAAARIFHDSGLTCAVHLPFFDLHPGSLDPLVRQACRERLTQAMDVAAIYAPNHFIAHLDYNPATYHQFQKVWMKNCVETWKELLPRADRTPVFLENVYEQDPTHLVELLQQLPEQAGACLDLGHWHCFAKGADKNNLDQWLSALAPFALHLHLHDNDGHSDQHLGLGCGTIPWNSLWTHLRERKIPVTVTLEPHTTDDFLATKRYLDRNVAEIPLATTAGSKS